MRESHPARPTPKGAPDIEAAKEVFASFCKTIAALRDPQTGCPWDLKQDHQTLRRFMIEEAYEAAEAMAGDDLKELRDELGDVLLQVVLNAQVALDTGHFSIVDVVRAADEKMRRRHPHVFAAGGEAISVEEVRRNWDVIKAQEKKDKAEAPPASLFAEAMKKSPASLQALKIGKLAAQIHFDWDSVAEVFAQVRAEVDELAQELEADTPDHDKVAEELGDVYFSLAQLTRHLSLDPEVVSLDANRKFLRRFSALEKLAASEGLDVTAASREALESLWHRVKQQEKNV